MKRVISFRTKATIGFVAIIAILALGMVLAIERLRAGARDQSARLRAAERGIASVERLRWNGELIVSAGRGYLISGDPELLERLDTATGDFDRGIAALRVGTGTGEGAALVTHVQQIGKQFRDDQSDLLSAKQRGAAPEALAQAFGDELLPLRSELGRALDDLARFQQARIRELDRKITTQRLQLAFGTYALLGVLLLATLGISQLFARQLTRAYQRERDAHELAREAVGTRDEVMAVVAHDLRNPLAAITMKAAVLAATTTSEDVRQHCESIGQVTMRMEYLIKSMLDVARADSGVFAVAPARLPARDIVRETVDMFTDLAAVKRVQIAWEVTPPTLEVLADRERIVEVLANLIGNALRFTPQRGEVTVLGRQQGEVARFSVADTGPGIAADHLPHVFERSWQARPSGHTGLGLGLFIARRIIDAHHGAIWVESEQGHGATFCFTIPLAPEVEAAHSRGAGTAPDAEAPGWPTS